MLADDICFPLAQHHLFFAVVQGFAWMSEYVEPFVGISFFMAVVKIIIVQKGPSDKFLIVDPYMQNQGKCIAQVSYIDAVAQY